MKMQMLTNSFKCPKTNWIAPDYSNDIVNEYELIEKSVAGPSGDSTDFTIVKEQKLVKSYHLRKVLQERAKGCSLKEIIARCEKTGDFSPFMANDAVYGDVTKQPDNLGDALQEGVKTSSYLDSLSESDKELMIKLSKMSESELVEYVKSHSKPVEEVNKPVEQVKEGE